MSRRPSGREVRCKAVTNPVIPLARTRANSLWDSRAAATCYYSRKEEVSGSDSGVSAFGCS